MYPAISLHEYRLRHPSSARVPTITQSGLLRRLLEQQGGKLLASRGVVPRGDGWLPELATRFSPCGERS